MDDLKAVFLKKKKEESVEDYEKRAYKNDGFVINGKIIPIVKVKYTETKKGKQKLGITFPSTKNLKPEDYTRLIHNSYNRDEFSLEKYINDLYVENLGRSPIGSVQRPFDASLLPKSLPFFYSIGELREQKKEGIEKVYEQIKKKLEPYYEKLKIKNAEIIKRSKTKVFPLEYRARRFSKKDYDDYQENLRNPPPEPEPAFDFNFSEEEEAEKEEEEAKEKVKAIEKKAENRKKRLRGKATTTEAPAATAAPAPATATKITSADYEKLFTDDDDEKLLTTTDDDSFGEDESDAIKNPKEIGKTLKGINLEIKELKDEKKEAIQEVGEALKEAKEAKADGNEKKQQAAIQEVIAAQAMVSAKNEGIKAKEFRKEEIIENSKGRAQEAQEAKEKAVKAESLEKQLEKDAEPSSGEETKAKKREAIMKQIKELEEEGARLKDLQAKFNEPSSSSEEEDKEITKMRSLLLQMGKQRGDKIEEDEEEPADEPLTADYIQRRKRANIMMYETLINTKKGAESIKKLQLTPEEAFQRITQVPTKYLPDDLRDMVIGDTFKPFKKKAKQRLQRKRDAAAAAAADAAKVAEAAEGDKVALAPPQVAPVLQRVPSIPEEEPLDARSPLVDRKKVLAEKRQERIESLTGDDAELEQAMNPDVQQIAANAASADDEGEYVDGESKEANQTIQAPPSNLNTGQGSQAPQPPQQPPQPPQHP